MDTWNKAAQDFYDKYGRQKNAEAFLTAYRQVVSRLPIAPHDSRSTIRALDLGCGTGELAFVLSEAGLQVTGIDVSTQSLQRARALATQAEFLEADMTALPGADRYFDAVFAMTSLEFCQDKRKALREVLRVLKPEGFFYLEVRNKNFVFNGLPENVRAFLVRTGLLKVYPAESFQDLSYAEWKTLFNEAGFRVEQEFKSLRPWAYGNGMTRLKNLLIEICKMLFPLNRQYMTAFLLRV